MAWGSKSFAGAGVLAWGGARWSPAPVKARDLCVLGFVLIMISKIGRCRAPPPRRGGLGLVPVLDVKAVAAPTRTIREPKR